MSYPELVLLSIALAADAFTVGAVVGLRDCSVRQVFRLSFHFGLFQALMLLIGFYTGTLFMGLIERWDHWLVFVILTALGVRMIIGAARDGERLESRVDLTRGKSLIVLSIAVSIDALAAGIGLSASNSPIFTSISIIGIVAAVATAIAMLSADLIDRRIGHRGEIVGGLILIGLGVKALYDHLWVVQ